MSTKASLTPPTGQLAKQGKPAPTQTRTKDAAQQLDHYVRAVRELFIRIGCGKRSFNVADARFAGQLHQRGVGLPTVENALLLGETRKWASWLSRGGGTPISSLRYFEPLIAEGEQSQQTFTEEYRRYFFPAGIDVQQRIVDGIRVTIPLPWIA